MRHFLNVRFLAAGLAILTLVAALYGPAVLASGGDAGTGGDASNFQSSATPLPGYGSYAGYLSPRDIDWYVVSAPSGLPQCVQSSVTGDNNNTATFQVVDAGGVAHTQTLTQLKGASAAGALAVNSVRSVYFGITASNNTPNNGDPARPGNYTFSLSTTLVPPSFAGDAGTGSDAGSTPASALPIKEGCTGGRFDTVLDSTDVYAFTVTTAGYYTYSLAATSSAVTAQLASGAIITPGQSTTVYLPSPGTYSLTTTRTSMSTDQIGYIIGIVGGDPPPCTPAC